MTSTISIEQTTLKPAAHDFSAMTDDSSWAFRTLTAMHGEELSACQLGLEHEAYTLGEARFHKTLERQAKRGEGADSDVAKPAIETLVPRLSEAFKVWMQTQETRAGRPHVAIDFFRMMKPDNAAAITLKTVLSHLMKKDDKCSLQGICVSIGRLLEEEARFGRIRDQERKHFEKHIKVALNKRNGHTYKVQFMEKVEQHMEEAGELTNRWVSWESTSDADVLFHIGIRMLELLIESTGLVTRERVGAGIKAMDANVVVLTEEWRQKLTERAFQLAGMAPMHQPTVVPPRPWTGMMSGGYWAKGRKPVPFIKVRSKKAMERYRHVSMPEVYKAVNIAQNSAWSVNKRVLEVAKKVMEWKNVPIKSFPLAEKEELPVRLEGMDEDAEVLKAWKKEAAGVYRRDRARISRRMSYEFQLEQAEKFAGFEAIYFPYNLDWRGRVYAIPSFNPQGNDMTKGLLQAAHGEAIGLEGMTWLMIHGANTAGMDKEELPDRIKWVKDNEALILSCAADPMGDTRWMSMDSPFCFLAFCFDWEGVKENGINHVSALPVAFDGSCSGIQHFSAMLRDEVGGAAVNLLPSKKMQDIYRLVADKVVIQIQKDSVSGSENSIKTLADKETGEITEKKVLGSRLMALGWLAYGVTRNVTKRSVMTLAYGSKAFGFADQVREDIIQPSLDHGDGKQFFADPQQCAQYMAALIWEAVSETVVAAVQAMEWLQKAAKLLAAPVYNGKKSAKNPTPELLKPCMPVFWVTHDGFPVWQEYMKPIQKRVELMFLGQTRIRATVNVKDSSEIDGRKQETGIAPNFVHSQDGNHMRMTVVHCYEKYAVPFFAIIHDSFGSIAAHAGSMFKGVRETFVKTYEGCDALAEFRDQFMEQLHETQLEKMPELPKRGTLDITKVLESDFAFI